MRKIKILHVVPSYWPATYFGGPIFSTLGLCNALQAMPDVDLRVLTTDTAGPGVNDRLHVSDVPTRFLGGYDVYYCSRSFRPDISLSLLYRLPAMLRWADVVHLTGVYSFTTLPVLTACRVLNKPLVWSSRGGLQRWDNSTRPGLKSKWEWLCNQLVQPSRMALHATSEEECVASTHRLPRLQSVTIPNGIELPELEQARTWCPEGQLRVLFMGRLHPIKGIENLIDAMSDVSSASLTICGDGAPAYLAELHARVQHRGLADKITFAGHVSGQAKEAALHNADVCVLPSYSENFGMVIAEALAHGVPVIASHGTPWAALESRQCGLWLNNSAQSLALGLQQMARMDLKRMGALGREWMDEDFAWSNVAMSMLNLYKSLQMRG